MAAAFLPVPVTTEDFIHELILTFSKTLSRIVTATGSLICAPSVACGGDYQIVVVSVTTPYSLVGGCRSLDTVMKYPNVQVSRVTLNITVILDNASSTCVVSEIGPVSFIKCKGRKVSYSVLPRYKKLLDAVMTRT